MSDPLDRIKKFKTQSERSLPVNVTPESVTATVPERDRSHRQEQQETEFLQEIAEALADPIRASALRSIFAKRACMNSLAQFCLEAWDTIEPGTKLQFNWHHLLVCTTLQTVFMDWFKHKKNQFHVNSVRNLLFSLPPGSLKPVHVDGLVTTKRGLIRAGDVIETDLVLTHKGRFRRVKHIAKQGVLENLMITTFRGRTARLAPEHPVLTTRGWIEAKDLVVGDTAAEVHQIESSGLPGLGEEARLVGYLIGDGCMRMGGASFTNQDLQSIEDFQHCASVLGFDYSSRLCGTKQRGKRTVGLKSLKGSSGDLCAACKKNPRFGPHAICKDCHRERQRLNYLGKPFVYEKETKAVRKWLTDLNLVDKNSFQKRVPKFIMEGDEQLIIEYLAAYWACDGGIHDRRDLPRAGRKNQVTNTIRITATTVSEGLARDHLLLFQRLGIKFKLRRKVTKLTKAMVGKSGDRFGEDYVSWDIVCSDQNNVAKFMQTIVPKIRHEKSTRALHTKRVEFDAILHGDEITEITKVEPGECVCFEVDEDSSFVYQGIAVHNSKLISVLFPAWIWLHCPSFKFIYLSVNEKVSLRDARDTRKLIRSEWYQNTFKPKWQLSADHDAIGNFGNAKGGFRISQASGSSVVGARADAIFIDDPNSPEDVHNQNLIAEVNTKWFDTADNRVNDLQRSLRIGVQQRLRSNDWTGSVLAKNGAWSPENPFGWLHVVVAAEYEASRAFRMPEAVRKIIRETMGDLADDPSAVCFDDPRTVEGETFHMDRFPPNVLEREKQKWLGTNMYASQMLQRPSDIKGDMIQRSWFGYFKLDGGIRPRTDSLANGAARPYGTSNGPAELIGQKPHAPGLFDFDDVVISLDCAAKSTSAGSLWGIVVGARRGGRRYILDRRSQRGDILTIVEIVRDLIRLWAPSTVCLEDKAAGPDLKIRLETEMNKGDIPPTKLVAVKANQGKIERAMVAVPVLAAGMVSLREGAAWLEEFVEAVTSFPHFHQDDDLDALVMLIIFWMNTEDDSGYTLAGW